MSLFLRRAEGRTTSVISFLALIVFLPLFILGVGQTITLLTRAVGTPANIVVDARNKLELVHTDFYHAFAQGGEESTNMLASVAGDVRALKPRVIRLDHIYDHYQVVGKNGDTLTFSWDKLDAAVSTILSTGAKPVFSLSYMPDVIAKDGTITNPPNDWNQWSLVVEKTIEHYSGKSGMNIAGAYYEVWNEPDLAQFGSWKPYGDKNYLTLYRYASLGAGSVKGANPFYLGGPATTGLYQSWIEALVKSGYRVDFFSWHSYLTDPKQFATDERNLISWLLPYPTYTLLPKLITEFGFTGNKHSGYGTMYSAAHTASVIRQLISGGPTYLFTFQLKDGPGQADGTGWGLMTHDDNGLRKKPRYSVFTFLDIMEGSRLQLSGEGSWVTGFATERDNTIRIMLSNFDANGSHSEQVPIKIVNLSPGTYTVRQRFLLGRDTTSTFESGDGTISADVFMASQNVAIIEITKR